MAMPTGLSTWLEQAAGGQAVAPMRVAFAGLRVQTHALLSHPPAED